MAVGDQFYRGPIGALDALRVGKIEVAIAALSPGSAVAAMIREGRVVDALTHLEREFEPKWSSFRDCAEAYEIAMGRACALPRVRP